MLDSFPVSLVVGTALGFLSGLGIGGGSLLILWLTMVLGMDQGAARELNLLFFLPSAIVSCCFRLRQGRLDLKTVFPAILAGCAAAVLGTWLSGALDTAVLKKGFGVLLMVTGIREVTYQVRHKKG